MPSPNTDKLAVLIDADNAQPGVASELLTEVARYGTATVKRAYGDWTTPNLLTIRKMGDSPLRSTLPSPLWGEGLGVRGGCQ